MVLYENKFWCKNINDLFHDWRLIPSCKMDNDSKINCLLRLLFIIFILCLIFNIKNTIVFLIFIIIIIIILYMIKGTKMEHQKENFTYTYPDIGDNYQSKNNDTRDTIYKRVQMDDYGDIIEDVNSNRFAYDGVELDTNDSNYISNNYKLVGNANPKTLIPPVIVPPIADLSYWKGNNLVTHTAINDNKNIDVYQSGYEVSNFCEDDQYPKINNNFDYIKLNSNYIKMNQGEKHTYDLKHNNKFHQKYDDHQKQTHMNSKTNPYYDMKYNEIRENFKDKDKVENIGFVNKSCGYDKNQFDKYGLPVNLSTGKCDKNSGMKEYNKNLYTQIIQPGVYTIDEVNEPINSNIGISLPQTFPEDEYEVIEPFEDVNMSNVYDPRFSGYGTSLNAGINLTLGKHFYLQATVKGGYINMPNIVVTGLKQDRAKQHFTFLETLVVLGYRFQLGSQ